MSEHKVTVTWTRSTENFDYQTYNRDHLWKFSEEIQVRASATPQYLGSAELVDPEQAYVASLSSCHMLTFLAIAAKRRLAVDSYEDHATGYMEKNNEGRLAITHVTLRPKIAFAEGATVLVDDLNKMHHLAHEQCFIANSVKTTIDIEQ